MSPLYLLPSSWWAQWVENISQVNTALIMGAPKGEQGITGGIPVDLLTLGLMQSHILGVAVVGIIFGSLLRVIQKLVDCIPNWGVKCLFQAYIAMRIAVLGIFYAQPALFISLNFPLLIVALVMVTVLKAPKISFLNRNTPPYSDALHKHT